jgi:GNAT superfamily N-acetyltransferase
MERIRICGWQVAYRHIFPPDELDELPVDWSRWVEWFANMPAGFAAFVAEEADGMLGWATVGPSGDERFGELHGLYVHPDTWSRGAGRALLECGEGELALTWDEAILWTLEDNPRTRRFYEAAGWRTDGMTGTFDRLGVGAPVVRYGKRLRSSASRS